MLQNFTFRNPTTMVFGKDAEFQVGELVRQYADKCLLHYDGGPYLEGLLRRVRKSLKDAGVEIFELGGVRPNPQLSLMRKGMELCREKEIGFVLAVGGGSVMDSAKFIALGAKYEGDPWLYHNFTPAYNVLPHGCVCTLPGTGSEVSRCSMVVNDEGDYEIKRSFFSEQLKFDFAIINPELTYTLPAKQTTAGAVDIISHYMEAYFTNTEDVDMLLGVAETGINSIMKNVKIVLENPTDYAARANMFQAAYYPMDGSLPAGTVSDWGVHGIENPLTVMYASTHGLMLGIMIPAWMRYTYKRNLPLYTRFCVNCLGAKMDYVNPANTVLEGICNFENFLRAINMPVRLSEIGIDDSEFEAAAQTAIDIAGGKVGRVSQLTKEEIIEIYKLAL